VHFNEVYFFFWIEGGIKYIGFSLLQIFFFKYFGKAWEFFYQLLAGLTHLSLIESNKRNFLRLQPSEKLKLASVTLLTFPIDPK
jgi:hypothetical protein